ncbi:energy transducer TonB [Andreprevotia chitinilytica]|uniref:energy transducer TonB n=1 Tax=Andreprevotia chitinilytica TaxID=396808 RepID=UPI00068D8C0C|nr:energy transducer TonB [Andreprevotia chitinilytica]
MAAVILLHAALLFAVLRASSDQLPEPIEPPSLTFIELPIAATPAVKPEPPKPQPAPQPQAAPKTLAKPPVPLPKSDTAPVAPPETAKPHEVAKEAAPEPAKESAQKAAEAKPAAVPAKEEETGASAQASYLSRPVRYPEQSRVLGEEGTVVVRIKVGEDGVPQELEVAKSSGFERLDADAMRTVKKWRFNPAKRGGKPIAGWATVPLNYSLK